MRGVQGKQRVLVQGLGGYKIRRGGGGKEGTEDGATGEEEDGSVEEGTGQRLGCVGGVGGKGSLDGDQGKEYQRDEEGPDGNLKCGKWVGVCFDTLLKNIYLGS